MTQQKQVILAELRRLCTHPTAEELYIKIKKNMPSISLATVYRNLDSMAKAGTILCIDNAGTHKRYDGIAKPHYHARCKNCRCVIDVDISTLPSIKNAIGKIDNFNVTGYTLEFSGYCQACNKKTIERKGTKK